MPTFFILFKTHKWNTKYFFPILPHIYQQLLFDIKYFFVKIFIFCLYPKVCLSFYCKTVLKYTKEGIKEFKNIQKAKMWFLTKKIFEDGFVLYPLLIKMLVVKLLWVRKESMNLKLTERNVKVTHCAMNIFMSSQKSPNIA
jgi:hypothetical protein